MTYEHILVARRRSDRDRHHESAGAAQRAVRGAHARAASTRCAASPARPAVRAVILAGNGPAFCAGHDLREMLGRELSRRTGACSSVCVELMTAVQSIPQPVIAQVHGVATAAGCQLVATCDLAVAGEAATLRHAGREHRPVLHHADGGADAAPSAASAPWRCCSPARSIDAPTAAEWGLVNRVVPADAACRRDARPGRDDRRRQPAHRRHRQAGLLRPDRSRPAQGLRLRQGSDEHERARRRRAGGHVRVRREAQGAVDGAVTIRRLSPVRPWRGPPARTRDAQIATATEGRATVAELESATGARPRCWNDPPHVDAVGRREPGPRCERRRRPRRGDRRLTWRSESRRVRPVRRRPLPGSRSGRPS